MRTLVLGLTTLGALLATGPSSARADSSAGVKKATDALTRIWDAGRDNGLLRISDYDAPSAVTPEACLEVITTARAAGVKDDDKLSGYGAFKGHPKQVQPSGGDAYLLFKDAPSVCEIYGPRYRQAMAHAYCEAAHLALGNVGKADPKSAYVADAERIINHSNACVASVDAMITVDQAGDTELNFWRASDFKIKAKDARAAYGEPLRAAGAKLKADIEALATADAAAIRKRFTDVGIKGDRLELFVYYGNIDPERSGWLARGCSSYVVKPKDLKKAKKLFQWLTAGDGTITVRTFTFKGDKYKQSERAYLTEERAYKGCR